MNQDIYKNIAERTGGDIYIGVVGPVRTGKSAFIKRLMEKLVIPNIDDPVKRARAADELPQSAGGKTILTSEPKFIPEEAVEISLDGAAKLRLRAADCVGYIVPDAAGYMEENAPRMVKTPWFEEEVPFGMAAEVGTRKIITEHSTVGIVVTTDGSITDIPREQYEECEERVIRELQEINKPFVVLLNTINPHSSDAAELSSRLSEKYGAAVVPVSCPDLTEDDIRNILTELLSSFPLREVFVNTDRWLSELEPEHWLREEIFSGIRKIASGLETVRDVRKFTQLPELCPDVTDAAVIETDLSTGTARISVKPDPELFCKVLREKTGLDIETESDILSVLTELCDVAREYRRIEPALREARSAGYGIIMPELSELTLEEPEIIKQGGKYGVRLRASAPSIHLMRADICTAVCPVVGTEKQSEELVMYLLEGFEEDSGKIWTSDIFGKSLHQLVGEGLKSKLSRMPAEARLKLQETIERIINDGCGGLVCIIL